MNDTQERINQLVNRLNELLTKQSILSNEVKQIRADIIALKNQWVNEQKSTPKAEPKVELDLTPKKVEASKQTPMSEAVADSVHQNKTIKPQIESKPTPQSAIKGSKGIESFIGENLISKIGIIITVIGVAIGTKYSIDHNLLPPIVRIIAGYVFGLGLIGVGIKLKKKYLNYSAVLVSGAMAIMYFTTFAAFSFYQLIPQLFAFVLMILFTVFTVVASINYNKQVIAYIGLVGAYAIPFLLSTGQGKVETLFTYMTILNIGIVIIAFWRQWRLLNQMAFVFTWLIYFGWFFIQYQFDTHYQTAWVFLSIFFSIFYLTFLVYKLKNKESFKWNDVQLLILNSFIFFGAGLQLLDESSLGQKLMGLYSAGNAILHFVVSVIIFKRQEQARELFFVVSGLVLVFLAIAIPIQLDGEWVTLTYGVLAMVLIWIGTSKAIPTYEKLSYPFLYLSIISLGEDIIQDKLDTHYFEATPFINSTFLTALLVIAVLIGFRWVKKKYKSEQSVFNAVFFGQILNQSVSILLFALLFLTFFIEINYGWNDLIKQSSIVMNESELDFTYYIRNPYYENLKYLSLIGYAMIFISISTIINKKWIKNDQLLIVNTALSVILLFGFLTIGLYVVSEMREDYLNQRDASLFEIKSLYVNIRYFLYLLVAALIYSIKLNLKKSVEVFDAVIHISTIWLLSSELLHTMDLLDAKGSYKIALSILWGVYALLLIIVGLWKKKKYLRIGGFVWFAVTLMKVFFYDIAHLSTIHKTIVFVSLGVLLLIASFLYNKFKYLIIDEDKNE